MSRSLHAVDAIVLGMVAFNAMAMARPLGLSHPMAVWALAMAWTCSAARRLIAWRRLSQPSRRLSIDGPLSGVLFLIGLAMWAFVPVMDRLELSSLMMRHPFDSMSRIGVALILLGVLRPMWRAGAATFGTSELSTLEGVGLLLVTGSPLLAGVTACGAALRIASRRPFGPPLPAGIVASQQTC